MDWKYEELYNELMRIDEKLTKDITDKSIHVEGFKEKQLLMEQSIAGDLILRAEIRQFLKESGITEI